MWRILILSTFITLPAVADPTEGAVELDILPGWRTDSGTHMAGLRMRLGPGWKTYWRAPGDAGIPPTFSWQGSRNIEGVQFHWPVPEIHDQNGMQTLGYSEQVVVPMEFTPSHNGEIRIEGKVQIGVCREICVPVTLDFASLLPPEGNRDAQIVAAMIDQPMSARTANVDGVVCKFAPTTDGIRLEARIAMPPLDDEEVVVVEGPPGANLWIGETKSVRHGEELHTMTEIAEASGGAFALDRGALRITVIGSGQAVDIRGCSAG